MPLGNGRLGMMPDGGVVQETIVLNDITMWSGSFQDTRNPEALKYLPEIRRLLLEGKNDEAQELMYKHFACGGPIAEELLFRGVIYGYLRRFMDIKLAIALSALIFGVYHMNYVQGIYGFLIGCLMAYAYEYFGEFKMAVFVHVASNVLAYCLSYTAIAVTGFVSWPVCVIFLTVAAVSLGMLHKQKNIF